MYIETNDVSSIDNVSFRTVKVGIKVITLLFKIYYISYQSKCSIQLTFFHNITDINIENNPLNLVIIYSDKEGPKSGLYLNRAKIIKKVDNLANIGIGVFDNKLFILDKENVNVLAYNSNAENIYNLSETLNELNLKDQTTNEIITTQNINPNSFNFQNTNFSFWTNSQTVNNTTVNPVNYIVTFTGEEFNDPVPNIQNQG